MNMLSAAFRDLCEALLGISLSPIWDLPNVSETKSKCMRDNLRLRPLSLSEPPTGHSEIVPFAQSLCQAYSPEVPSTISFILAPGSGWNGTASSSWRCLIWCSSSTLRTLSKFWLGQQTCSWCILRTHVMWCEPKQAKFRGSRLPLLFDHHLRLWFEFLCNTFPYFAQTEVFSNCPRSSFNFVL